MLTALIATALVETFQPGQGAMHCAFPARSPGDEPVEVVMRARPSLKDLPGLYRVELTVNGKPLRAAAQPITGTEGRDVLVRASRGESVFYAIGFDDNGTAAYNMVHAADGGVPDRQVTLTGFCRNYERFIHSWSDS